jgi:Txe/YoeB family toxin of Txe-Axe toxin-antitoxin module
MCNYTKHLNTQRHKLNIKTTNDKLINENNIVIDKIDNLAKQNEEVIKQNNNLAKKNEELQQKIEQLEKINNQNTNKIVKEARAIKKSILTILNTNFKDTPSIDYIKEEEFRVELETEYSRKIDDNENRLFIRIFNDYNNNILIKTLSDLILKFIKKKDQKTQPVFNIDSARGNYATKIEDFWHNDKSGLQLKKYTLDMVIKYMLNVLDIFRQRLEDMIKKKNKTQEERDYVMFYQDVFIEVRSYLINTNTHKKVILYMCPELRIDDKVLNAITEK